METNRLLMLLGAPLAVNARMCDIKSRPFCFHYTLFSFGYNELYVGIDRILAILTKIDLKTFGARRKIYGNLLYFVVV
jgi:hypothetical protein